MNGLWINGKFILQSTIERRQREAEKKIAEQEDIIIDLVDQGCSYKDGLNTMALSTYQDAVGYLVGIGKARWINKGFTFEFVGVE